MIVAGSETKLPNLTLHTEIIKQMNRELTREKP
jgi:hypothetical protein